MAGASASKLLRLRWRRALRGVALGAGWRSLQRALLVAHQLLRQAWLSLRWLVVERESLPTAYALTAPNRRQLAAWLAAVARAPLRDVQTCLAELDGDKALRDHLRAGPPEAARLVGRADYGSRVAAYVLTRLRRPRTVVESGVDTGLVACLVAAALERNAAEGHSGSYFGLDPHPGAGRLLAGRYERHGWILAGAPVESLEEIEEVDLYLHSRRCSQEQEGREYETLSKRLSKDALVLSRTAHAGEALHDFALESGRRFLYFAEEPHEHWYRGGGLGAAY